MSKNNQFINSVRKASTKFQRDVEEMAACTAIALNDYTNISKDDIDVMLFNIQDIWCECINKGIDPIKLCEEKTGIDIRRKDKK